MAGQLWAVNSLGGFFYSDKLSKNLRVALQPLTKFRQFCDVRDETSSGKGKGDTYKWDCVFNLQTQGGTLVETNTMPETNFKIAQASASLYEWGNSIPWTGKLEALSQFSVRSAVEESLTNDTAKVLDSAAYTEFNKCQLRVVPKGSTSASAITLTTDSVAGSSNGVALGKQHVRLIAETMQERTIPYYDKSNYVCITRPTTLSTVKVDLETINSYVVEGYQKIMSGEVGKFENVRFVLQTNVASGGWANALSDWAFFFGKETACEGICEPEHVRAKIPDDYGRSKGLAWYAILGFGITHNWAAAVDTGAANGRILKWDSVG